LAAKTPESLEEVAEAYFYIAALSHDGDSRHLRKAASFSVKNTKWYSDVGDFLLKIARPSNSLIIHAGEIPQQENRLIKPGSTMPSSASNSPAVIIRPLQ
jgi:hypothetical protein